MDVTQGPVSVEQLLKENANLRAKLTLSLPQRIVEKVALAQANHLLNEAGDQLRVCADSADNAEHDGSILAKHTVLTNVLAQQCDEKKKLEDRLLKLQTTVIEPLNEKVERLVQENGSLQARIVELEAEAAQTPQPALVQEVRLLRQSEALLQEQLKDAQSTSAVAFEQMTQAVEGGMRAAAALPEYIGQCEQLRAELRDAVLLQQVLSTQLEEQRLRHILEREIADQHAWDVREMQADRMATLQREVCSSQQHEQELVSRIARLEAQLQSSAEAMQQLQDQSMEREDTLAVKRQRMEQDALYNPTSIRGEFIRFWYEGRREISSLEQQVENLEKEVASLRVPQGRVAQVERSCVAMTSQLVSLATELKRVREENQRQRAQYAGLEAERDRLLSSMAMVVQPEMNKQTLIDCCCTIREAAAREAAASASVVADPAAQVEAMRHAQELKNEVEQLQKQKDKLLKYIGLRESRCEALLAREVLRHEGISSGDQQQSASPAKAPGHVPLTELLEYIGQCAKDVFRANEQSSQTHRGEGVECASSGHVTPHTDSFVTLQMKLLESQEKLREAQRCVHSETQERQRMEEALLSTQKELEQVIKSKDDAAGILEEANAALTRSVTSLAAQLKELRRQYDASVNVGRQSLLGLSGVYSLLCAEMRYVSGLRHTVEQERGDMIELLRREARAWGGEGLDGAPSPSIVAATQGIAEALDRLREYMDESIAQVSLQSESERTAYIAKLSSVVRAQETRLEELMKAFEKSSQEQAASLAERIVTAQQQWETQWKHKYQSLEEEHNQLRLRHLSESVLHTALERIAHQQPTPVVSSVGEGDLGGLPVRPLAGTEETLAALELFMRTAKDPIHTTPSLPIPATNTLAVSSVAVPDSRSDAGDEDKIESMEAPAELSIVAEEVVAPTSAEVEPRDEDAMGAGGMGLINEEELWMDEA